eukprot:351151-Chlamydomonas_euryale.AAC.4
MPGGEGGGGGGGQKAWAAHAYAGRTCGCREREIRLASSVAWVRREVFAPFLSFRGIWLATRPKLAPWPFCRILKSAYDMSLALLVPQSSCASL